MQALIRTLFDITLLRKGPEDIPHSWLLLMMSVVFWLLGLGAAMVMLKNGSARDAWVAIVSAGLSVSIFVTLLVSFGRRERVLQTLTAIIGCGALVTIAMLVSLVLLSPYLGARIAYIVVYLVLAWSVLVKGHIIARAMDWHWYPGIAVAMATLLVQLLFTHSMSLET